MSSHLISTCEMNIHLIRSNSIFEFITPYQIFANMFSVAYTALCDQGELVNPNRPQNQECDRLYPNSCPNGYCVDTSTYFRCECNRGYILNSVGECVGKGYVYHLWIRCIAVRNWL